MRIKIFLLPQQGGIYNRSEFLIFNFFPTDEITASFRRFGPLVVDWPHKAESKSYFPPKGYAFLLFQVHLFSLKITLYNRNHYCLILGKKQNIVCIKNV